MRKSARLTQKLTKPENSAQMEPKRKKKRSDNNISNIATLDNGTMIEAFKYLHYMQLAKSGLVSKRFSNLIQTHRHSLALLYVDYISMYEHPKHSIAIEIFNKQLSPKEYSQWDIRNNYSKLIPLKGQVDTKQRKQYGSQVYEMHAYYKNPRDCNYNDKTNVFFARKQLNHKNWPLFQHFARLLTDPFIYIDYLRLTPQIDISFINLLAEAINPECNRVQCGLVILCSNAANLENMPKFIKWTKDHVHCNNLNIRGYTNFNYEEELLDFYMTGANSASTLYVEYCDLFKQVVVFVQKFIDLKSCDECQLVEYIAGHVSKSNAEILKRSYTEFCVKVLESDEDNDHIQLQDSILFKFVNKDIGKKLQLTITNDLAYRSSSFSLKIARL